MSIDVSKNKTKPITKMTVMIIMAPTKEKSRERLSNIVFPKSPD